MSEFHVPVVRLGPIEKHPHADALSITRVFDYPVILRTGDFKEGDLAVYIPVDAVVPTDERWAFLGEHRRIRAKRLRGIFSMGLLTSCPVGLEVGQSAQAVLSITKYEPSEPVHLKGENERDPGAMPVYDIEGLRRYPELFQIGELVSITEKIHGTNGRWVHDGVRLWAGSHKCVKRDGDTVWWQIARKYNLAEKLKGFLNVVIYGEVYGNVQDLKYGVPQAEGCRLVVFDAFDTRLGHWLSVDELKTLTARLDLPVVPELFRGPWSKDLVALAEGKTTMPGADHVREGIVVKPLVARFDPAIGRVFLKLPGEGYLTRKGG